jgi:hypothetical protein
MIVVNQKLPKLMGGLNHPEKRRICLMERKEGRFPAME